MSAATGEAWVNVLRQQTGDSPNPDHQTLDITAQSAGASDVRVRFHYYNAQYEWWWQVDNVRVDYVTAATCTQIVCAATPATPGRSPTARSERRCADRDRTARHDHRSELGRRDLHFSRSPRSLRQSRERATAAVSGAACDLGTSGTASWTGVPAGNLWFVVVGDNGGTVEGSWGKRTDGERGGSTASAAVEQPRATPPRAARLENGRKEARRTLGDSNRFSQQSGIRGALLRKTVAVP
jgi:hypothetical protein